MMDTMYELSPAGLSTYLVDNNYKIAQCKDTLALDEFLSLASKSYISSILL